MVYKMFFGNTLNSYKQFYRNRIRKRKVGTKRFKNADIKILIILVMVRKKLKY